MRLLCLVLAFAPLAMADEETARYFVARASRALDDGKLDDAEKFFKRSLEEKKDFLPSLFGLADLARRKEQRAEAIAYLERCLAQKGSQLGPEERKAVKAAEEMLEQLDSARVEYRRMVARYVERVLDLARASVKKSPDLTRECCRTILLLDPDNAGAKALLAKAPEGNGVELFNGKDLEQWTGKEPVWTVQDGSMRGVVAGAGNINRFQKEVTGDFTLTCELRVVKNTGDTPLCGIVFGLRGAYDHFALWMWPDEWRLSRQTEEHKHSDLQQRSFKRYRGKFLSSVWHAYRIVRKGKRVTCFVDGQELWSFAGTDRTMDGFVGIWVQDREIEVRRVCLEQ